jgi:hypothetical protein
MSATTTKIDRYTSNEPILTTSGGDAQNQLARMKARAVARYNLEAIPGRPEELRQPGTDKGVSFGYGCKTIRVRAMTGRNWLDHLTHDFQVSEGWGNVLYALLDGHFGFKPAPTPAVIDRRKEPKSLVFNHPNTGEPLGDAQVGFGDN